MRTDYSEHNQAVLARQAHQGSTEMDVPDLPRPSEVVFTTHQPVPLTPHAAAARANTVVRKREVNVRRRPPSGLRARCYGTYRRFYQHVRAVDGEPG